MNVIRTRDVVFNEGSFEQMKILFKSFEDEMNVDNKTKPNSWSINDYLPVVYEQWGGREYVRWSSGIE